MAPVGASKGREGSANESPREDLQAPAGLALKSTQEFAQL